MKMTYDDFEPGHYYLNFCASWLCGLSDSGKVLTSLNDGRVLNLKHINSYGQFSECDRDGNLLVSEVPEPAVGQVWRTPSGKECVYVEYLDPDNDECFLFMDYLLSVVCKGLREDLTDNMKSVGLTYVRTLPGV